MAKILDVRSSEGTLHQIDGEAVEAAEVEDTAEMLLVRVQRVGKNQCIIQIDVTKWEITKDFVHDPLESLGGVPEAKREAKELEEAKGSGDGSLGNVGGSHGNLEITFLFGKVWKRTRSWISRQRNQKQWAHGVCLG